jgi:hypothetical protein
LPFAHHERTQILPLQLHASELAPVVVLAAHAHLLAPVQGQPRERLAGRLAVGLADLRSIDAVEPQLARRAAGVGRHPQGVPIRDMRDFSGIPQRRMGAGSYQ